MMVMWSKYDGSDDAGGEGVTDYMEAEVVWKPLPDGGRERVHRVPPPEVVKGDAALMRQAIRAVPFQCKYNSAVLSFEHDDVDVVAFNDGDAEQRRRVDEVIQGFEDVAYAGIPEEHRPPTFWTTHTHTGRLELNFVAPRAILAGSDQIRSINPHPPGAESRRLFDAFRDVANSRYGWADPEDPARARLVSVPNYLLKIAAEAKRAGKEVKKHLTEQVGEWAEAALAAGQIHSRDDLVAKLRGSGIEVTRKGKDYVTLCNDQGVRIRLRGRIFSADFTSPEVLRPREAAPPRLDLAECEARLAKHQERRAHFHQLRYGGPAWEATTPTTGPDQLPSPIPLNDEEIRHARALRFDRDFRKPGLGRQLDVGQFAAGEAAQPLNSVPSLSSVPLACNADRSSVFLPGDEAHQLVHQGADAVGGVRRPGPDGRSIAKQLCQPPAATATGRSTPARANESHIEPALVAERRRYKAQLWVAIFGATLAEDLLMALRWVDRNSRTVRLADGAVVIDHGDRISASRSTALAAKLMVAEALAKGWTNVRVGGSNAEFRRQVVIEAVRAGLTISNRELQDLVAREKAMTMLKEGGDERIDADGTRVAADGGPPASRDRGTRAAVDRADQQLDRAIGLVDGQAAAAGDRLRQLGRVARPGVTRIYEARSEELVRFKTEIDLCAVAASLGFAEDRAASDRNHTVMRHADGTKMIIGVAKATGHWAFSSNAGAQGTVLDLLKWRAGLNTRGACERLRQWLGEPAHGPRVDAARYIPWPKPASTPVDALKAVAEWESANLTSRSAFLERSRGIAPVTLASSRFSGTFRVDERQNAVFPYRDGAGAIIGTERRNRPPADSNRSFKTYTAGACPGIWTSNTTSADTRLVIVESPIDAMSYQQMLPAEEAAITRYAAIRNGCSEQDLALIIASMPHGSTIVAACDADAQGDKYNDLVRRLALPDQAFRIDCPPADDWNASLPHRPSHGR